jgi:hypothetical protein
MRPAFDTVPGLSYDRERAQKVSAIRKFRDMSRGRAKSLPASCAGVARSRCAARGALAPDLELARDERRPSVGYFPVRQRAFGACAES